VLAGFVHDVNHPGVTSSFLLRASLNHLSDKSFLRSSSNSSFTSDNDSSGSDLKKGAASKDSGGSGSPRKSSPGQRKPLLKQFSLGGSARRLLANIPDKRRSSSVDSSAAEAPSSEDTVSSRPVDVSSAMAGGSSGLSGVGGGGGGDEDDGLDGILFTPFDRELAVRYNDSSPLENMHLAVTFSLLRRERNCFLNPETLASVRGLLVQAVLGTDMAKHAETMTRLGALIDNQEALHAHAALSAAAAAAAAAAAGEGSDARNGSRGGLGSDLGGGGAGGVIRRKSGEERMLHETINQKQVIPWYWPSKPPPSAKDNSAVRAWEIKLQEGFIVELFLHAADIGSPVSHSSVDSFICSCMPACMHSFIQYQFQTSTDMKRCFPWRILVSRRCPSSSSAAGIAS
jgi:hypothetical protein